MANLACAYRGQRLMFLSFDYEVGVGDAIKCVPGIGRPSYNSVSLSGQCMWGKGGGEVAMVSAWRVIDLMTPVNKPNPTPR